MATCDPDVLEQRSTQLARRLDRLRLSLSEHSRAWAETPVIASQHQAELCERLGFRVVGVLPRPEDTDPRDLERLLSLRPALVVANLQEGTRAASVVADRLGVPLAVLSAFPDAEGWPPGYVGLVEGNVARLAAALGNR